MTEHSSPRLEASEMDLHADVLVLRTRLIDCVIPRHPHSSISPVRGVRIPRTWLPWDPRLLAPSTGLRSFRSALVESGEPLAPVFCGRAHFANRGADISNSQVRWNYSLGAPSQALRNTATVRADESSMRILGHSSRGVGDGFNLRRFSAAFRASHLGL